MKTAELESWRDDFVLTVGDRWTAEGTRAALQAGALRRICRGVYLREEVAATRSSRTAHRDLAYAHELLAPGRHVFSHATAAALWNLPRIGSWPKSVHTAVRHASGGRTEGHVIRHTVDVAEVDRIDGLMVTPLLRTVVDVCRSDGFLAGALVADQALSGFDTASGLRIAIGAEELMAAVIATSPGRGSAIAREVALFATAQSGSPGETLSRVRMRELGVPAPVLQHEFRDRQGVMYADFCWPAHRVIGEFDGLGKYLREDWTDGRTAAEVVIDEKRREDRLRRLGWTVVRWEWADALVASRLRAILADGGIRPS